MKIHISIFLSYSTCIYKQTNDGENSTQQKLAELITYLHSYNTASSDFRVLYKCCTISVIIICHQHPLLPLRTVVFISSIKRNDHEVSRRMWMYRWGRMIVNNGMTRKVRLLRLMRKTIVRASVWLLNHFAVAATSMACVRDRGLTPNDIATKIRAEAAGKSTRVCDLLSS